MSDGRSWGLEIEAIVEADGWESLLGEAPAMLADRVIRACAAREGVGGAVAVLFADDAALQDLNRTWRGKDAPTNVLSFPAAEAPGSPAPLGDIALALETIAGEAQSQGKRGADHAAHLIVHGFLHLIGYDHVSDEEAGEMETREREILATLGVADPYAADSRTPT